MTILAQTEAELAYCEMNVAKVSTRMLRTSRYGSMVEIMI